MKYTCIYHRADLDGKCSAAIVLHYLKDFPGIEVDLIPWNYGEPLPDIEDEDVFMVDCCPNEVEELVEFNEKNRLVWIDHHGDKIKVANELKFNPLGTRREGLGACALVWEFIYPDKPMPKFIRLLSEYDVWDHSDPDTLPFQWAMRGVNSDPGSIVWFELFSDEVAYLKLLQKGHHQYEYQVLQWENYVKSCSFETHFHGLRAIACNVMMANSMLFDSIWDERMWDVMIIYGWRRGQYHVSLYTTKKELNLGEDYAKLYGGGGHPSAAGFQCHELPFELK